MKFGHIPILSLSFFLFHCASIPPRRERLEGWKIKDGPKPALLAHYDIAPEENPDDAEDNKVNLLKVVKTAAGVDEHPFRKFGEASVPVFQKMFADQLHMTLGLDPVRAKKIGFLSQAGSFLKVDQSTSSTLQKAADVFSSASSKQWFHPDTSPTEFHELERGELVLSGFKAMVDAAKGSEPEEYFVSIGATLYQTSERFLWTACGIRYNFRVLNVEGRPVFEGYSSGEATGTIMGNWLNTNLCIKALKNSFKNLKKVEETTFRR